MNVREAIVEAVERVQGCKATELVTLLPADVVIQGGVIEAAQDLVDEGELVEVDYTLITMPWRVKSFLLPKGSKVLSYETPKE